MPRPLRLEVPGALHHVIVRGNERRPLFFEDRDRLEYLDRLATCRRRFGFSVYSYCLMTNHAHLAIEQGEIGISKIMHWLQSTYAGSINRRRDRIGHLFHGRFKSFLVDSERYLLTLIRYIHLNPVEAGLVDRPHDYPWSSDRYFRAGFGPPWLDIDRVLQSLSPDRASSTGQYLQLMGDFEGARAAFAKLPTIGAVHGDQEFAARTLRLSPTRRPRAGLTAESLAIAFTKLESVSLESLRTTGRHCPGTRLRPLIAHIGRDRYGIAVARFSGILARDESTLVRGVLDLERRLGRDAAFRRTVRDLANRLDRLLQDLHG